MVLIKIATARVVRRHNGGSAREIRILNGWVRVYIACSIPVSQETVKRGTSKGVLRSLRSSQKLCLPFDGRAAI